MRSYVPFIIVSTARTGSTMLVQALNSHPHVRCFREVFNARMDYVDFSIEGYDNFNEDDIGLRRKDPVGFLRERVFCPWPEDVRAVGFKFLYEHHKDVPDLVPELVANSAVRVIHLRRENELRMLVSERIAQRSGIWVRDAQTINRARLQMAVRHPLRAASRLRRFVMPPKTTGGPPASGLTITPQECAEYIVQTRLRIKNYDTLFSDHEKISVSYEEMTADHQRVFANIQAFLDLEPRALTFTVRQQNPEPLRDLISNYDELHQSFKGHPEELLFS